MRFIDGEGKLFNKINIIDLIFLLLVLFLIGGVYFRFFGQGPLVANGDNYRNISVIIRYEPKDAHELEAVASGDQLVAENRLQPIYVEDVQVEPQQVLLERDGRLELGEHPSEWILYIEISGQAYITETDIFMANQNVKVGREFFLKTLRAELVGTVAQIVP